jgi:hypothetical protein
VLRPKGPLNFRPRTLQGGAFTATMAALVAADFSSRRQASHCHFQIS